MRPIDFIWAMFLSLTPLMAQLQIEKVPPPEARHMIQGFSASGSISLQAISIHLTFRQADGRSAGGELMVLRDPGTGHFMWTFVQSSQPNESKGLLLREYQAPTHAIWVASEGLIDFSLAGQLHLTKYAQRSGSLDIAERLSLEELKRALLTVEKDRFRRNAVQLLIKEFDRDFSCPPLSAICLDYKSTIESVSKDGDNWRLVLRNRYDVELMFDSKFNWVSTKQLTDSPTPKLKTIPILPNVVPIQ